MDQNQNWLVVWTPLKNISQLGWLFPIYGKTKTCSKPPTRKCLTDVWPQVRPRPDIDGKTCFRFYLGHPVAPGTCFRWPARRRCRWRRSWASARPRPAWPWRRADARRAARPRRAPRSCSPCLGKWLRVVNMGMVVGKSPYECYLVIK